LSSSSDSVFINSELKVLIQEGFQPIVKLHVARRFSSGILGRHLPARLATQPVIRAEAVAATVPVSEHFQFLSFCLIAEAEVLI
jgi:hypothetical protein